MLLPQVRLLRMTVEGYDDRLERAARREVRLSQELGARAEQLRVTHEAHKLLSLEVSLKDDRLRSVEDTLATERTRQVRPLSHTADRMMSAPPKTQSLYPPLALPLRVCSQGRERDAVQLLRSQNQVLADTLQSHVADLAKERSRAETALMKLAQREESAQAQLEELRQAEIRGDSREARMRLLRDKTRMGAESKAQFDSKLEQLHERLAGLQQQDCARAHRVIIHRPCCGRITLLSSLRFCSLLSLHSPFLVRQVDARQSESHLILQEVTRARASAESERSAATKLRQELTQVEARLGERDEQLALMQKRMGTAREDLQVQLALIEEEMSAAQLKLDAKGMELDLVMEEATGRERQASPLQSRISLCSRCISHLSSLCTAYGRGSIFVAQAQLFMQTVTERLQKAHRLMVSKDELLASLSNKLRATAEALKAKEQSEIVLRTEAGNARSEKEKLSYKLGACAVCWC